MWRILLVCEDEVQRSALRSDFEKAGHEAVDVRTFTEALVAARSEQPEIALIDYGVGGNRGPDLCRELKASLVAVPVMVIVSAGDELAAVASLEAGADDCVGRPLSFRELLLRVRILLRTTCSAPVSTLTVGPMTLDFEAYRLIIGEQRRDLSRAEFRLLRSLVDKPSRVWTRGELLDEVWGLDSEVDARVVDGLVARLRGKLGVCARYIQTVRGVGYRLHLS